MKKAATFILLVTILVGVFAPVSTTIAATNPEDTGACGASWSDIVFGGLDFVKCAYQIFTNFIYTLILSPFATFLGIAGMSLDATISYTIVHMSDKVSGANAFTGINIAWKLIRDMMNIFFIFILVYEAILLILGQSSAENIGKFIGYLVLAALLVNFSLFFTKILIDASNVVTIGIYNNIINTTPLIVFGNNITGMSIPFMASLGLGKLFSNQSVISLFGSEGNAIIGMIMSAFFMFIAGIVFIVISIMFIVRYVTLLLLLMLSPIGFMGSALSFMRDPAKRWWTALNSQLIFPPVYMLMTWVVLTLMQSEGFIRADNAWEGSGLLQNKINFVMNFVIIIVLMIATLIISKDVATKGSNYIGKMTTFAGGAVLGLGAAAARRTVGKRYDRLAQDKQLLDRAAQGDRFAKAKLATYRGIAGSSMDVRDAAKGLGADIGQGTKGVLPAFLGGDAKVGQGGYRKIVENKAKKEEEYAKSLKMSAYEKAQNKATMDQYKESKDGKDKEEEAKKVAFDNNPEEQAKLAENRKGHEDVIKAEEDKIKKIEQDVEKAVKDDLSKIETNVQATEDRLRELRLQLDSTQFAAVSGPLRADIQKAEKERQDLIAEMDDKRARAKEIIAEKVQGDERVGKGQKKIKKANEELDKIQKEYKKRRDAHESVELKEMIARAGGREADKDKGLEKIDSYDVTRIEQRADYLGNAESSLKTREEWADNKFRINPLKYYDRLAISRARSGKVKPINIEVSAKVRGLNKSKTAKQLIDEAVALTGEKPAETAAAEPVVAPTATPANTGGGSGGTTT